MAVRNAQTFSVICGFNLLILILSLILFRASFSSGDFPHSDSRVAPSLTPIHARNALREMATTTDSIGASLLSVQLDDKPIHEIDDTQISIGFWRCDLRKKTFEVQYVSKAYVEIIAGKFTWSGEKWRASIDKSNFVHFHLSR
jgi:hypothetical protein